MKHNDEKKSKLKLVKNLRYTIWTYFVLFIFVVIVLMWFFQLVILPVTYQNLKIQDIKRVGKIVSSQITSENYREIFDRTAYDNNMCIKITDFFGNDFYSIDILAGSGAISPHNDETMRTYREMIMQSDDNIIQVVVKNERFNTTTLLYGRLIGTKEEPVGFLFLNTSLDPLGSTISILEKHLFLMTIILLIIGLILADSVNVAQHMDQPPHSKDQRNKNGRTTEKRYIFVPIEYLIVISVTAQRRKFRHCVECDSADQKNLARMAHFFGHVITGGGTWKTAPTPKNRGLAVGFMYTVHRAVIAGVQMDQSVTQLLAQREADHNFKEGKYKAAQQRRHRLLQRIDR